MVLPITYPAPTTTGIDADVLGSFKKYKSGARQKKPFDLNLPYRMTLEKTVSAAVWDKSYYPGIGNRMLGYGAWQMRAWTADASTAEWIVLESRLSSKLTSEIRTTAELGVSLAEGKQALTMITTRLMQLAKFGIALKRFRFAEAATILGVKQDPRFKALKANKKLRRGSHSFSSNYLEFHFGWSPMIGDIGDAMAVLDEPLPYGQYQVRSGVSVLPWTYASNGTYYYQSCVHHPKFFGRAGCRVKLTNPNLFLASNMGLTNPASIAWELVPFSFVVDWFVNVGDYIKSFSDLYGVEFEDPWFTRGCKVDSFANAKNWTGAMWKPTLSSFHSTGYTIQRQLGMPQVRLHRKRSSLFADKPRRALAAASLLIQQGLGKR